MRSMTLEDLQYGVHFSSFPEDQSIVCLCSQGLRSGRAAEYLRNHEMKAQRLVGGIKKWEEYQEEQEEFEDKSMASFEQEMAGKARETEKTIFDMIISGEIPSDIIYQDELCLAFRDVNPQAAVHFLVIPKIKDGLSMLERAEDKHKELLGHLLLTAAKVAKQENLAEGYRVVINNGPQGC